MADSPNKQVKDLVSFKIKSAGKQIKDTYMVFSVVVDYAVNRIPTAVIKLQDGDVADKDFEAANSKDFIPGTEIEIQSGYDNDDETIFKGIVINMRIILDTIRGSVLEITCRDKAILMTQSRKSAYFSKMKDSDVMSSIIASHSGIKADVDSTSFEYEELLQYDGTDWEFMMIRADINGFIASIKQGTVSVKAPDTKSQPVLSLTYGVDIIEFEADFNASDQMPGVDAVSWDAENQAIISQTASEPSVTSLGNIMGGKAASSLGIKKETLRSSAQLDSTTLQAWAEAKLLKSRLAMITGSATFNGSSLVYPNTTIELNGIGERFSGTAFVSAVKHIIQEGNWSTRINFGLKDEWFATKPNVNPIPASGLTPEIGGLMIAKVKQLNEDPANENRILVTLPMIEDDNNGLWARLATFYATNEKGNFFIPEIDDEVVLGFLNNDPNYPIILGSLYSSKNSSPYELTAENYTKAIVTKQGSKIEFDDEKKVINIETPGENIITISDEDKGIVLKDQNNNKITTNTDGISIEDSNGNKIVMSSSGIEIKSATDLKLSATNDVSVSGNNITNSANIAMKSSGQASAEFSASGQTTIKGAMVMIN